MNNKKQRKFVAKLIRRRTGIPYGVAHTLAREFIDGTFAWPCNETAQRYIAVPTSCKCCGPDTTKAYAHGPRGTISRDEIGSELDSAEQASRAAYREQCRNSAAKRASRYKRKASGEINKNEAKQRETRLRLTTGVVADC